MTTLRERLLHTRPKTADDQARIQGLARPLAADADLDPLLEQIGDARYVLLGEASHGTSEYYTWRARISKRLIQEKGFSFVAVEGDWPDCYHVNRYVKGLPESGEAARVVLRAFERWPTWMWANWEIVAFAEWLRRHNDDRPPDRRAGFYGLDVYSLWESLEAVLDYLERTDPDAAGVARHAYRCFEPYGENVQEYARATAFVDASCEAEVIAMLQELRANAPRTRRMVATPTSTPSRMRWSPGTRNATTGRWSAAVASPGTCGTGTWRRRWTGSCTITDRRRRRSSGSITRTSATLGRRT